MISIGMVFCYLLRKYGGCPKTGGNIALFGWSEILSSSSHKYYSKTLWGNVQMPWCQFSHSSVPKYLCWAALFPKMYVQQVKSNNIHQNKINKLKLSEMFWKRLGVWLFCFILKFEYNLRKFTNFRRMKKVAHGCPVHQTVFWEGKCHAIGYSVS